MLSRGEAIGVPSVTRAGLPCASSGAGHVLLELSTSLCLGFLFFFLNFRCKDNGRFLSLLFFDLSASTYMGDGDDLTLAWESPSWTLRPLTHCPNTSVGPQDLDFSRST